jgi:hypothetical protein
MDALLEEVAGVLDHIVAPLYYHVVFGLRLTAPMPIGWSRTCSRWAKPEASVPPAG